MTQALLASALSPIPPGTLLAALTALLAVGLFAAARSLPKRAPGSLLRLLRARPLGRLEAPVLQEAVRRLALAEGGPEPALQVVPHPQANLFVLAGADGTPVLAVTQGALDALAPAELEAAVGAALARAARPDLHRATVATAIGVGASTVAGLGMVPPTIAENRPWTWPLGAPFLIAGALLARAVGGPPPCARADLRGAAISGRALESARLLEHMEFTAHACPMPVPAALARLALVHPRGSLPGGSMASLFPAPEPAAPRAALLRGAHRPGGPSRARAA